MAGVRWIWVEPWLWAENTCKQGKHGPHRRKGQFSVVEVFHFTQLPKLIPPKSRCYRHCWKPEEHKNGQEEEERARADGESLKLWWREVTPVLQWNEVIRMGRSWMSLSTASPLILPLGFSGDLGRDQVFPNCSAHLSHCLLL